MLEASIQSIVYRHKEIDKIYNLPFDLITDHDTI